MEVERSVSKGAVGMEVVSTHELINSRKGDRWVKPKSVIRATHNDLACLSSERRSLNLSDQLVQRIQRQGRVLAHNCRMFELYVEEEEGEVEERS